MFIYIYIYKNASRKLLSNDEIHTIVKLGQ